MDRKHWVKENHSLQAISAFPHSVFKRLVLQTLKKPRLVWERVNSRPHNKFLDMNKFKANADDKCFLKVDFLFIE